MSIGTGAVAAAAVIAVALVTWGAVAAWNAWSRLWRTVDAASALLDVHMGAIDDRTQATADVVAAVATSTERAAAAWTSAIAGVRELSVLRSAVEDARGELHTALLDVLLPTPPADHATRRDHRTGAGTTRSDG